MFKKWSVNEAKVKNSNSKGKKEGEKTKGPQNLHGAKSCVKDAMMCPVF